MSYQNSIKLHIFIASKGEGLSLDTWHSRKAQSLLQNIYLMLELWYHKHNPLIITAADGNIF